jgi:hemerythrin
VVYECRVLAKVVAKLLYLFFKESVMAVIQWSKVYETGNLEVDRQHQMLFKMVNDLHDGIVKKETKEVLTKTLTGLAKYTVDHFAVEENLMINNSYPDFKPHREKHQDLVKKVGEVIADYQSGKTVLAVSLLQFLSDWLRDHIEKEDIRMIKFMQSKLA